MKKFILNGKWTLNKIGETKTYDVTVPGNVFSDLHSHGVIPNPLTALNENLVQWVGECDWSYTKQFTLTQSDLEYEFIELNFEMLDTLAKIFVNDTLVASTDNINRHYAFNVKPLLKAGINTLRVDFSSPLEYIKSKQEKNPLPNSTLGEAGSCHIRKSPYHFGWDWGPHLLTAGISKDCYLKCFDAGKITRVDIKQIHRDDMVELKIDTQVSGNEQLEYSYTLTYDDKQIARHKGGDNVATLDILHPKLWWCNNMGEQALYDLEIIVSQGNKVVDTRSMKIGLRTIKLDTKEDMYGKNFCFYLNGKKIFARGANWVPADSFITNVSTQRLHDLISKAKDCNMNMLRVWGGGYYESDAFYDLCDRMGILVWQDFNFACSPYPFDDKDFVSNVLEEVKDNVLRIKNHACLCLWAGNNEIESMSMAWLYKKDVIKYTGEFFYKTLPEYLKTLDDITPYWACTPSSGTYMQKINSCDYGDTHLWHVWHGMRKLDYYAKNDTRFCSEFGIESLPSLNAIDEFSEGMDYSGFDTPIAKLHQKCIGGNSKITYYMLSKFWTPENFLDTVYLSQLTQGLCVKNATEGWRIKNNRCHGALYWQYNDCWGVSSWAGMDYYRNMKALQYMARRFNQNTILSIQCDKKSLNLYLVNDGNKLKAKIRYGIASYDGMSVYARTNTLEFDENSVGKITTLDLKTILGKRKKSQCYFYAVALDEDEKVISFDSLPLTDENKAQLPKAEIAYHLTLNDDKARLELVSSAYARFVEIRLKGLNTALSDNYFDMLPNHKKIVEFDAEGETVESLKEKLSVRSLCDIKRKNSALKDRLIKSSIFFMPVNFVNYILRTFDK